MYCMLRQFKVICAKLRWNEIGAAEKKKKEDLMDLLIWRKMTYKKLRSMVETFWKIGKKKIIIWSNFFKIFFFLDSKKMKRDKILLPLKILYLV